MINYESQRIKEISKYRKHIIEIYIIVSLVACISYFMQFLAVKHMLAVSISIFGFISFSLAWVFLKYNRILICKIITLLTGYIMIALYMNVVFNASYKLHYHLFFHLIYYFTIFEFRKGKSEVWFVIYFLMNSITFYIIEFKDFNQGNEVFVGAQKDSFILSATLGAMLLLFLLMFSYSREIYRINQTLSKLATLDLLTGAYNQQMFQELSENVFDNQMLLGKSISYIIFDIDNFKKINDQFGHSSGDLVLKKISSEVINSMDKEDVFGRIGGDEFALVLKCTKDEAFQFAENLRSRIELTVLHDNLDNQLNMTISVGISTSDKTTLSVSDLKSEADQALYVSKRNSKNKVYVYNEN